MGVQSCIARHRERWSRGVELHTNHDRRSNDHGERGWTHQRDCYLDRDRGRPGKTGLDAR